jgi:hypothetical protein
VAQVARRLVALWCLSEFIWIAPRFFDGSGPATTIPVVSQLVWVAGLMVLLAALFIGLVALAGARRWRVVRAVLYAASVVGAAASSIALVGFNVSAATSAVALSDRRTHALMACAVALGLLAVSAALLRVAGGPDA